MRRTQEVLKNENEKFRVSQEGNKWIAFRFCPGCGRELQYNATEQWIVRRNIRDTEKDERCCTSCGITGEKNPFYGKRHTEEAKLQVSKSRTGKGMGENSGMSKQSARDNLSKSLRAAYNSGRLDYVRDLNRETMKNTRRLGKLKNAPFSTQEKEIELFLIESGIDVGTQFLIDTLKYDIHIKETNILIEFNGDYWHCNPEKYNSNYFNKKKNMFAHELWKQDEKKKLLAENNGYKLFTIWEKDYKLNKDKVLKDLIKRIYE